MEHPVEQRDRNSAAGTEMGLFCLFYKMLIYNWICFLTPYSQQPLAFVN